MNKAWAKVFCVLNMSIMWFSVHAMEHVSYDVLERIFSECTPHVLRMLRMTNNYFCKAVDDVGDSFMQDLTQQLRSLPEDTHWICRNAALRVSTVDESLRTCTSAEIGALRRRLLRHERQGDIASCEYVQYPLNSLYTILQANERIIHDIELERIWFHVLYPKLLSIYQDAIPARESRACAIREWMKKTGEKLVLGYVMEQRRIVSRLFCSHYPWMKMMQHCIKKNKRNEVGDSLLHYLAEGGYYESFNLFFDPTTDTEIHGFGAMTLLMCAAAYGHQEIIERLVASGADVNMPAVDGSVPLMCATYHGRQQAVHYLIEHKADIKARSSCGDTPLMMAAKANNCDNVKLLLAHGAHINERDNKERTALMCAAKIGYPEIVELLIENNADINTRDADGNTALILAVDCNKYENAEILIKYRAEVNDSCNRGISVLRYAMTESNWKMVELLAENGVAIGENFL